MTIPEIVVSAPSVPTIKGNVYSNNVVGKISNVNLLGKLSEPSILGSFTSTSIIISSELNKSFMLPYFHIRNSYEDYKEITESISLLLSVGRVFTESSMIDDSLRLAGIKRIADSKSIASILSVRVLKDTVDIVDVSDVFEADSIKILSDVRDSTDTFRLECLKRPSESKTVSDIQLNNYTKRLVDSNAITDDVALLTTDMSYIITKNVAEIISSDIAITLLCNFYRDVIDIKNLMDYIYKGCVKNLIEIVGSVITNTTFDIKKNTTDLANCVLSVTSLCFYYREFSEIKDTADYFLIAPNKLVEEVGNTEDLSLQYVAKVIEEVTDTVENIIGFVTNYFSEDYADYSYVGETLTL